MKNKIYIHNPKGPSVFCFVDNNIIWNNTFKEERHEASRKDFYLYVEQCDMIFEAENVCGKNKHKITSAQLPIGSSMGVASIRSDDRWCDADIQFRLENKISGHLMLTRTGKLIWVANIDFEPDFQEV